MSCSTEEEAAVR